MIFKVNNNNNKKIFFTFLAASSNLSDYLSKTYETEAFNSLLANPSFSSGMGSANFLNYEITFSCISLYF